MGVRRSGQSSYWSFYENAPRTRLYRDDVASLLALLREKGATARLISGEDVELDSAEDIPSLSGRELRSLSITTRNPAFTFDLKLARTRLASIDQASGAQEFGNAVLGFLRQHRASPWERIWIELFRARVPLLILTAAVVAFQVPVIVMNGFSPFLFLWAFGPAVGASVIAAANGTGTWVTRRTREDVYQRREDRGWSIAGFVGTTIFGAILGAGVTYFITQ